jgi:hypothetical protein
MRLLVPFLALAVAGQWACGERPPSADDVVGTYSAELPATSGPGRNVTLDLVQGNVATMRVAFADGRPPVEEAGTWSLSPAGEVRVVLARDGFGPVTNDLTFRLARSTLTAIAFDTVRWSAKGFSLARTKH